MTFEICMPLINNDQQSLAGATARWAFSLKASQLRRSKGVKFGGMLTESNRLYYDQMSYRGAMLLPYQVSREDDEEGVLWSS